MLRRNKTIPVDALADQLSEAHIERNNRIAAANDDFEAKRIDVIVKGEAKAADLRRLEAESRAEAEAAEALVAKARR